MVKSTQLYKSLSYILINSFCAVLSKSFVYLGVLAYAFCVNNMNNPLNLMIILFGIEKEYIGLYKGML